MNFPLSGKKTLIPLFSLVVALIVGALACNLPFAIPAKGTPSVEETHPNIPVPSQTTVIQNQRETAQAGSTGAIDRSNSGDTPEPPEIALAPNLTIQPADVAAIPNCNTFDINEFNMIIEGSFSFVTQDQLNNCHFESDNGFRLLIGGGKPVTVTEIQDLFNSSFGQLPDSTWDTYGNFYLGLAYSSVSVTAQGVSNSGHSIVIVAGSQPAADSAALQAIFTNLAKEAASQLNSQFQ